MTREGVWTRLGGGLAAAGKGLSAMLRREGAARDEAFMIAAIALGAKMAKADGRVTRDEVMAFREIFDIADADLAAVGRFYDLARQDVAGYDVYARRVARLFEPGSEALEALLDGLFHIARSDGRLHDAERAFLAHVGEIFGFDATGFERVRLRHAEEGEASPYAVLGVRPDATPEEIREAWKARARALHPDRLRGQGLPEEAQRLAQARLAQANAAYQALRAVAPRRD